MNKLAQQLIELGYSHPEIRDDLRKLLASLEYREAHGQFPWSRSAPSRGRGPLTNKSALYDLGEAVEKATRGAIENGGPGYGGSPGLFLSASSRFLDRMGDDLGFEYFVDLGKDGKVVVELTVYGYDEDFNTTEVMDLKKEGRMDVSKLEDDRDETEIKALTPVIVDLLEKVNREAERRLK